MEEVLFLWLVASDQSLVSLRREPARQLTKFWNTAIVIFIFCGYEAVNVGKNDLGWSEGIMAALNTWWVCEDWMSVYTSEWHHQDFGCISFVEITKNDECAAEVCLCARTSVSVWYRICWLLCHAFSARRVCHSFQIHSENEYRGRERNDHLKWRLRMGQVFWVTAWNEWLYQRRRGEWIADTVTLKLQERGRTDEENKRWIWGIKLENSDL